MMTKEKAEEKAKWIVLGDGKTKAQKKYVPCMTGEDIGLAMEYLRRQGCDRIHVIMQTM